jgi:amidase
MSKQELVSLSAVEMRRRIGTKEISPVELLEACLDRIEEVNPGLNAVTAMCVARARKEAKAAETAVRRGEELPLLHGLPTGIKDLEETKDLRLAALSRLCARL